MGEAGKPGTPLAKGIKRRKNLEWRHFVAAVAGTRKRVTECREYAGVAKWRSGKEEQQKPRKTKNGNIAEAAHYAASQNFCFKTHPEKSI